MGITLGMGFDLNAKLFLDGRQSFISLSAMKNYPVSSVPEGFLTYCTETELYYKFSLLNENDSILGKWREFSVGSKIEINDSAPSADTVYSSSKVETLFKEFGGYIIVTILPTSNINIKKIYLKVSNADGENNVYDEYIYVQTQIPISEELYNEVISINYSSYAAYSAAVSNPVAEPVFTAIRTANYSSYALYAENNTAWDWECIGSTEASSLEYTTSNPVNNPIGSIPIGWVTAGTSVSDMFDKLLHKEILPTISLICSDASLKEKDVSTVANPVLSITTSAGTCQPVNIQLYKNEVELGNVINYQSGTNSYTYTDTGTNITENTTYKAVLTYLDELSISHIISATYTYQFVLPYYYGVTANVPTDITGLTKDLVLQSERSYAFTGTSVYSVIMFDANYGNLTSIIDQNGFQCKSGFTKIVLSIADRSFNCYYTSLPATLSGFVYTFR